MSFFLFLFAALLIYMKLSGRIKWSWLVVASVAIGLLFFTRISATVTSFLRSVNPWTGKDDPVSNPNAACGCGPNQLVLVKKRRFFGKDPSDTVSCSEFLTRSSKWYIAGCIN